VLWSVKGGRHGEYEQLMLDKSLVLLDWDDLGDLRQLKTRVDIEAEYMRLFPNASPARRGNHVGQLWAYAQEMQGGDIVVVRMKTRGAIAVGQLTGPYEHRADLSVRHAHPVNWLQTDLPPDRFGQDLLYSFGAQKTISRIRRNNAEARVRAIAQGRPDPGLAIGAEHQQPQPGEETRPRRRSTSPNSREMASVPISRDASRATPSPGSWTPSSKRRATRRLSHHQGRMAGWTSSLVLARWGSGRRVSSYR